MKLNTKEIQVLSVITAIWGVTFITTGLVMNNKMKPIVHTVYSLKVESKKIAEAQAKTNEIKLKDIEIEINTPISVDIKDYLQDVNNINEEVLKSLKLDTSLVKINEAGEYPYTIVYNKKKYQGKITVKEKQTPNIALTLKTIQIYTGESLPTVNKNNPEQLSYYINETIPPEVLNTAKIVIDISQVKNQVQGDYNYFINFNNTVYQGTVKVRDKIEESGITTKTPNTENIDNNDNKNNDITCPSDAVKENNNCKCNDPEKEYKPESNSCITKKEANQ